MNNWEYREALALIEKFEDVEKIPDKIEEEVEGMVANGNVYSALNLILEAN